MSKRYNEEFINLLEQLTSIMTKHGEQFRAKAYRSAQETLMKYPDNIVSVTQLTGLPGIGPTIMDKFKEYTETGTLRILEQEKTNPINILTDVYGIGPKKAEELVKSGINTIVKLRTKQDEVLNAVQKIGLEFYEDILQPIPRAEIEIYEKLFDTIFVKNANNKLEIVGSYRRGALKSGDIDIIITSDSSAKYHELIDELIKQKIILHVLSRGDSKTLVIAKLPGNSFARRIDFLYSPPDEFAFALLYFTGSKVFNVTMRQKALDQGYTFNEHGIYYITDKKKGEKVQQMFPNEKSIFDFLGLKYKTPLERQTGPFDFAITIAIAIVSDSESNSNSIVKKKNKTLKKKVILIVEPSEEEAHIKNFIKNGISVLEALSESELNQILGLAASKYTNQTPIMTDNQYDIIHDFIESKYPNNMAIH